MSNIVALWLPSILQLLLAWHAKRSANSWLYPSAFYNLYWGFAFLLSTIVAPDYDIWPGASWFVLLSGVVLHAGAALGSTRGSRDLRHRQHKQGFMPRWTLSLGVSMLTVTTILGVIAVLIIVRDGGYSPREIIDPENVARMAQAYSALRYSAGANQPLAARVLLGFAYVGALLGGVAFALRLPWRVRLLACLPTVTVLAQSVLMTSRTPSVYSFSLLAGSYLAVSVLQRRDKSLTRWTVVGALAGVAVLWTLVFGVQLLREGSTIDRGQVQFGKSRAALFGSPAVFSHWLRDNGMSIGIRSATMGAGTFAGLYELLGIVPRMQGIWAETERLGGDEQKSNVHSAFRQLIEDFTLPGALFVTCIWGILAGTAYRRLTDGAVRWLPVLTCFYVFVMCSYVSSVLTYNSTTFGLVMFGVLVSPRPLGFGMLTIERPRLRKRSGHAAAVAADRSRAVIPA